MIHRLSKPELKGHAPKKLDPIYEIKLDRGSAGQLGDSSDGAVLCACAHLTPPSWPSRSEGNQQEPGVSPDPCFGF